jgi:hypothetical protein
MFTANFETPSREKEASKPIFAIPGQIPSRMREKFPWGFSGVYRIEPTGPASHPVRI